MKPYFGGFENSSWKLPASLALESLKLTTRSLLHSALVLRSSFDVVRSMSTGVELNVGFFFQSDENSNFTIVFRKERPIFILHNCQNYHFKDVGDVGNNFHRFYWIFPSLRFWVWYLKNDK